METFKNIIHQGQVLLAWLRSERAWACLVWFTVRWARENQNNTKHQHIIGKHEHQRQEKHRWVIHLIWNQAKTKSKLQIYEHDHTRALCSSDLAFLLLIIGWQQQTAVRGFRLLVQTAAAVVHGLDRTGSYFVPPKHPAPGGPTLTWLGLPRGPGPAISEVNPYRHASCGNGFVSPEE